MRRILRIALSVFTLFGLAIALRTLFGTPADNRAALQAAQNAPDNKPNLSLWVPEEELRVWDPVNPNVNPIPFRVLGPKGKDGERSAQFRHEAIGKRVRVEGIAWGYDGFKTAIPKSRVVFEGGTVLVKGVELNKPAVRGKMVRVVGTLGREVIPREGFNRGFPDYYFIDAKSFEVIEKAAEPNVILEPSKD